MPPVPTQLMPIKVSLILQTISNSSIGPDADTFFQKCIQFWKLLTLPIILTSFSVVAMLKLRYFFTTPFPSHSKHFQREHCLKIKTLSQDLESTFFTFTTLTSISSGHSFRSFFSVLHFPTLLSSLCYSRSIAVFEMPSSWSFCSILLFVILVV